MPAARAWGEERQARAVTRTRPGSVPAHSRAPAWMMPLKMNGNVPCGCGQEEKRCQQRMALPDGADQRQAAPAVQDFQEDVTRTVSPERTVDATCARKAASPTRLSATDLHGECVDGSSGKTPGQEPGDGLMHWFPENH